MKRLLLLTTFVFIIARVYGQGTQVGDSNSPIFHYNGNLGIGIELPNSKLDIFAQGEGRSLLKFNTERPWEILQTGIGSSANLVLRSTVNAKRFIIESPLGISNASFRVDDTPSANRVFLCADGGNVGIGTNTPDATLHVDGPIKLTHGYDHTEMFLFGYLNGSAFFNMKDSQGNLNVKINTSGESFINGGNVGIGTTTPDYKLDVLGTIRANEVKVATGWSDFVFESGYDLPTLQEVESYIAQNGHLPDIPSAEEVKADGISLGEMDAKLLQKIEELTLYVIELKKENDSMKKRIELIENEK